MKKITLYFYTLFNFKRIKLREIKGNKRVKVKIFKQEIKCEALAWWSSG